MRPWAKRTINVLGDSGSGTPAKNNEGQHHTIPPPASARETVSRNQPGRWASIRKKACCMGETLISFQNP